MRSTLNLKFIVLYIIFGFLSIFTISALSSPLIASQLEKNIAGSMYQSANLISTNYLNSYFTDDISLANVYDQIHGMSLYQEATIWFVEKDGTVIASSYINNQSVRPSFIENFDPLETRSSQYIVGNYHNYFNEDVITIITPVTEEFSTKGYLIVNKSYRHIEELRTLFMNRILIIFAVVYALSFLIFIGIQFFIYRPLRKITEAATQYASGNLDVVIPVNTQDEMGYLSASLNYMSTQLKDMEEYQKSFVANVSHDFRSPLTSIRGYVTAMADGTIPPKMQEKYLNIILYETERLTDLTQDLLTLNQFDTNHLLLNKKEFDIHEVIRNTASSFEGVCTGKHISIELLLASRVLNVYADPRKIQQVLYNLLDNAIKFSHSDSTITIETTERGDKAYISVKDNGIGIPRKNLNKIWERFYKTDLSRGKDKKGTGLGLSIVKEIIQAHNENINVISTEGVGTEFVFSLSKEPK